MLPRGRPSLRPSPFHRAGERCAGRSPARLRAPGIHQPGGVAGTAGTACVHTPGRTPPRYPEHRRPRRQNPLLAFRLLDSRWVLGSGRDGKSECCPVADRAFGHHRSTVPANDALDGRQPDSVPREFISPVESLERQEQLVCIRRVEPRPVIPNIEDRAARTLFSRFGCWIQGGSWAPDGMVNRNVAPWPTEPSAITVPPCRRTMRWTVASPTPCPGNSSARWSRWNGRNSLCAYAGSNPAPLSRT